MLDEGTFVATYKFALLQSLADLSVEKGDDSGEPLEIQTKDIARKFIQYYAPQALPYPSPDGTPKILKQNPSQQAEVIGRLEPLVAEVGTNVLVLRNNEQLWNPLVTAVTRKIK
ncbi:MAG: HNH endonuclease, partial [bacterium]|nr:HNH endonuclease [bacterium]